MATRYFRRLQRRYCQPCQDQIEGREAEPREPLDSSSNTTEQNGSSPRAMPDQPGSLQTPVVCINLLRCNMQVS